MGLRDFINELKAPAAAATRGVLSGGTAGFYKYPAAAMMVGLDQVLAKNPRLTMGEALELVNEQQQEDRRDNLGASLAGEVVGSLVPGSQVARGVTAATRAVANPVASRAAGVLAGMAGGATHGALASVNENQDFENVGTDAAIGAAGGALGSAVQGGVNYAARKIAPSVFNRGADLASSSSATKQAEAAVLSQRIADLVNSGGNEKAVIKSLMKDQDRALRSMRSFNTSADKSRALAEGMADTNLSDAAALQLMDEARKGLIKGTVGNIFSKRALGQTAGSTVTGTALGALGGGGLAAVTGNDPLTGALYGAGAGGAGGAGVAKPIIALKTGVARKVLGNSRGITASGAAVPVGQEVRRQASASQEVELDPWEVQTPKSPEKDPWEE